MLSPGALTVQDVLDLPATRVGSPQVVVGHRGLDRTVRWVHVGEAAQVSRFLEGGEVVLTTGATWPEDDELTGHLEAILEAGAIALVLELGSCFEQVPPAAVEVFRRRDVPLVVLHHEVQFVAITEAAHRLLVANHLAELEARDHVLARFAELDAIGASSEMVIEEVAHLLSSPVVLEDVAHRVVWCASHAVPEEVVLADWSRLSRVGITQREHTATVEVAARGRLWGRLLATQVNPDLSDSLVELVMTQAATSLSVVVLGTTGTDQDPWEALRHHRLATALTQRRLSSPAHVVQLLETVGLSVSDGPVVGLALTTTDGLGTGARTTVDDIRRAASRVAGPLRIGVLCGIEPALRHGVLALLALPGSGPAGGGPASDDLVEEFVTRLRAAVPDLDLVAVGAMVHGAASAPATILTSLTTARDLAGSARPGTRGLLRARGTELDVLLQAIPRSRMDVFTEDVLGPLLDHDARHGSDLLPALEGYLRHPGNRSRAARESHLSRSSFYQRLDQIEALLGRDLRDGGAVAALSLALSAYRRGTPPSTS